MKAGPLVICSCGKVYLNEKGGKRRFCSPRCQRRVHMRRWRAEQRRIKVALP